tara:strand:+ start:1 stop:1203 length:1203 start_codon:yes stop_codon:yes gene_type:complete
MFMTDDNQDVLNFVNELYPVTQPLTLWRNAVGINMSPSTAQSGNWVQPTSAMPSGYVLRVDGGVEVNVPAGQLKIDDYGVKFGTTNQTAYFGFGSPNQPGFGGFGNTSFTYMAPNYLNVNGYINATGLISASGQIQTVGNVVCSKIYASTNGSMIAGLLMHTGHNYASVSHSHNYAGTNHGHSLLHSHSPYSDDRIKYNETLLTDHLTIINKLVPKRYEKILLFPGGAAGMWIPTDEEWETIKAPEPEGGPVTVDPEFDIQPIKDWYYESGFIAQDLLADPVTSHLVKGEPETVLTDYIVDVQYERLSDEEKAEWTLVPDDERKDYWKEGEVHYQQTKLTQTPLMVDMQAISVASVGAIQELSSALDAEKAKNVELTERVHIMEQLYQGLLERVVQLESL